MGLTDFDIKVFESDGDIMGLWNAFYKAREDVDHTMRMKAITAIGRIGGYEAVKPLVKAISDKEAVVRKEAAFMLISLLENELIGLEFGKVQAHARTRLSMMKDPTKALEIFIELLNDSEYKDRAIAALALGWIGSEKAVEPLLNASTDNDNKVRRNAAKALGDLKVERAVEPLIQLLEDESYEVRASAAYALGWIKDEKAAEPIIKLLKDGEHLVRANAAYALGLMEDKKAVESLIKLLGDESHEVRANAAYSLGEIGDEKALEPLMGALEDKESRVRANAVSAIKYLGNKSEATYFLIKLLADEDRRVRYEAASALVPILKDNLESIDDNDIKNACRLIFKNTGVDNGDRCDVLDILLNDPTPEDLSVIIDALFETEYYPGSPAFHSVLISVLAEIGKPCIPAMAEALNNKDTENDIRVRAVKVLGRMNDPEALAAVRKAALDENLNVQNVAISALKNLEDAKGDNQNSGNQAESDSNDKREKKRKIPFWKKLRKDKKNSQ